VDRADLVDPGPDLGLSRAQGGRARWVALVVDRDVRGRQRDVSGISLVCLAYFERLARSRASLRLA
jgi:hypothetical protein